ncbi:MAG: hypothetical protein AAGA96_05110 [Verrucomicrobiota bacterium]
MIAPDPQLSEQSPEIERSLARAAESITPHEFRGLIGDPGLSVLRSAMDCIKADSISVWLADTEKQNLVVTHCDPDKEFIGFQQAISEGLIALVYASEQALCENSVYLNADHSKKVDQMLGQVTCAMIATPFYIAGTMRGVITAVQLKESDTAPDPAGFSARNLNRVGRLSTVLERLVNYRLLTKLLDLEL